MVTLMKFIMFNSIFLSYMLAFSSETWFSLWLSLELNMMSFIPLMYKNSWNSTNSMIKYFFIQSFASSLFLMSCILTQNSQFLLSSHTCMILALTSKLGMFPVYFWFIQVSEGLSWIEFLILSTSQKLIPMFIISLFLTPLLYISLTITAFLGCINMMNQTSLRKILAFSSLAHMSWMILGMMNNPNTFMVYLMFYMLIMISLISLTNPMNLSSLSTLKNTNTKIKYYFLITILSLGGLPPLMGFAPKWLIVSSTSSNMMMPLLWLLMLALISIFLYLRMSFPMIFYKTFHNIKNNKMYNLSLLMNTSLLIPLTPCLII